MGQHGYAAGGAQDAAGFLRAELDPRDISRSALADEAPEGLRPVADEAGLYQSLGHVRPGDEAAGRQGRYAR